MYPGCKSFVRYMYSEYFSQHVAPYTFLSANPYLTDLRGHQISALTPTVWQVHFYRK